MSSIKKLPEDVASRIAAGEVIERPASVLKELLENALDAKARKMDVEVLGAGRKLLRVADDGAGMSPSDCRQAFERHTTSKIFFLEDLQTLATFGFRGEALFSIAAVSRVALTSCVRESRKGWRIELEGGRIAVQREAPPVQGTQVDVRDLFYNTPARLKFLRSDTSEKGHLTRVLEETALANPQIAFSYKSEGRVLLRFAPALGAENISLAQRIREVLGKELGANLLYTEQRRNGLSLCAFLSPTEKLLASRNFQIFFVNRRPIVSRVLQQALYRVYEPFRPKSRHPIAMIYLDLPSKDVDVNVHPAKREVRFHSEGEIFETVVQALSKTLLQAKGIPTLTPDKIIIRPSQTPIRDIKPAYRYGDSQPEQLTSQNSPVRESQNTYGNPSWFDPELRYLGQIESAYLVFDASGGLLVVDQHAAQERILFERYLAEVESGSPATQSLMLPISLELPASQIQRVLERREQLKCFGFELEPFGKTTLQVTSAPALFSKAQEIQEMVHRLISGPLSAGAVATDIKREAAATIACKAAVKAHDALSAQEALRLVKDLKTCQDGSCCPHGRPTMLSLDRAELARRFKRPGPPPL